MHRSTKALVSAFLPLLAITTFHGCGGGGGTGSTAASSQVSTPASPVAPPAAPANQPPTISGSAAEIARVGQTYDYLPVARDPEGDELRFSAVNLPPWASIDPANGRISGTPGENDLGVYEAITITVADAARSAQTTPFSITVIDEVTAGLASLRWEAPPSKFDGSPLDDLAGYRILYGRSSNDLDQSVFIADPAITAYEFTTLPSGIWYFAVVAVNSNGLEGPPTVTAMKSI